MSTTHPAPPTGYDHTDPDKKHPDTIHVHPVRSNNGVEYVGDAGDSDRDSARDIEKRTSLDEVYDGQGDIDHDVDPHTLKRLLRKIDWRLIPVLIAMYAVSLIDRTNLAIARQANNNYMDEELGTDIGDRYSIVTLVFFIPYIIFELPSQLGLRRFGARIWLGSAVTAWGFVMLGMGFVPNWGVLAVLRALLGAFESALFPGAAFLISCWYPRKEMAQRNAVFYISSAVAGSFAKPVGYAFSLLDGRGGYSGWRWMFILYGILTIVVGIIGYFLLVDVPHTATFLTVEEKKIIQTRIERDRADSIPDALTAGRIWQYIKTPLPWLFALCFMSVTMSAYALAYFLPRILQTMGFGNVESMLLGTPAYFYSILPCIVSARIADRIRGMRGYVIMFNSVCIIAGTAMYSQLPSTQRAARFAGVFLALGGGNSNIPLIISWQGTAIRAQSKRAYCSALIVAFGGIGGIMGSCLFFQKEAAQGYPTGVWTIMGLNIGTFFVAAGLSVWFRRQNKRAERGHIVIEKLEGFRYQP